MNNDIKKVAVVMSVYDGEKSDYLNLSLASILNDQTYKYIDLYLAIDGRIRDELQTVVSEYKLNKNLKIYQNEERQGLSVNLNNILIDIKDQYDYIARMDSDDISFPRRIEKQVKFLEEHKKVNFYDFQGSTWAPHLIHKELWNRVGGFSEEFYPGTGSDPDLNMKLWNEGVRIFKNLSKSKIYHFKSKTLRRKISNTGSKSGKIFLKKWGYSIKFFKKYYLESNTIFKGELTGPKKNFFYYFDLLLCKINYFFVNFFFKE